MKCSWGSWGHCGALSGFSEGPGGKALRKFTILSLKLVQYSFLEIKKIVCLLYLIKNCYYNLKIAQLCLLLLLLRSRMKQMQTLYNNNVNPLVFILYKHPHPFCAMIATDKLRVYQKMKAKQKQFLYMFC